MSTATFQPLSIQKKDTRNLREVGHVPFPSLYAFRADIFIGASNVGRNAEFGLWAATTDNVFHHLVITVGRFL